MAGSDEKSFVFGDVFGIMRVVLGKKLGLKTTPKAAAPRGGVTVSSLGKRALVNGRAHTGVYGHERLVLLKLPTLGVEMQQAAHTGPVAFAGELVACLERDGFELLRTGSDPLTPERTIRLAAPAQALPRREVGPQGPAEPGDRRLLHIHSDGRFAAYVGGKLWAGRIGATASEDEVRWSLPLGLHPTVALGLVRLDHAVWLTVMDHAAAKARLLSIVDGALAAPVVHELDAIGLPAVTEEHVVYQPTSDLVVRRNLRTGAEERFEVAAFNEHPQPAPEPGFYKAATLPPPPDRLPGRLHAGGEHILFVPWHAETVVELTMGKVFERSLQPGPGPLRRGVREILARDNAVLAELQLEADLDSFDMVTKHSQCPMGIRLPSAQATLLTLVASGFARRLTDRFELRTHGWGWGSFSGSGNLSGSPPTADLDATRQVLRWMMRADILPLETDKEVGPLYAAMFGIPHEPRPDSLPFRADAERLWLRAMLETIASCGWPVSEIPEAWAKERITPAQALTALRGLSSWTRYRPYDGLHLLSCALVHHLDRDAQSVLLALIVDDAPPFNWKQYRDAGELLVVLCKRHPDLAASSIAAIAAVTQPGTPQAPERQTLLDALGRGARHLWSNG